MIQTIKTLFKVERKLFLYNIICILIFAFLYYVSDKILTYEAYNDKISIINSIYFSTVTQTTLGFGDIVPTHEFTKILVSLQCLAVLSIMYLI